MALFSFQFFIFLTLVIGLYYIVPGKLQKYVILAANIVFYYFSGGLDAMVFIVITTLTTWFSAYKIESIDNAYKNRTASKEHPLSKEEKADMREKTRKRKKRYLAATLLINFGILGILKYGSFIIGNINAFLPETSRIADMGLLLPLGISFYTFQSTGYLIDVYRGGKNKACRNLIDYAVFTTYFPQMIQGPINRYNELGHQLVAERKFDSAKFREGFSRLLWGYFKKMVIAERTAIIVNEVFNNYELHSHQGFIVFIGVFFYGVQIYADFSGGMDIVLGASEIMGIDMLENFRQPFMAKNVAEFWRRWHMTLGNWMRDYVFYPIALSKPFMKLGRSLKKKMGTYYGKVIPSFMASFIVFILVGIWHGASWKYIAYGVYQAIFVSTATLFEKQYNAVNTFLKFDTESAGFKFWQMIRTTFVITIGRYFSRAASFTDAMRMYKATFSHFNPWVLFDGSLYKLGLDMKEFHFLILMLIVLLAADIVAERGVVIRKEVAKQNTVFRWAVYLAAILMIVIFGVYGPGFDAASFIYQNF